MRRKLWRGGSLVNFNGYVTILLTTFHVKVVESIHEKTTSHRWFENVESMHGCLHTDVSRMSVSTIRVTGGC